ncbi:hypothetical protein [Alteromonas gracilis]|uniref:hypothetical protein n=1 Tax=Alteromonas gracilis TaxID=1479524 RepID=UPI003734E983
MTPIKRKQLNSLKTGWVMRKCPRNRLFSVSLGGVLVEVLLALSIFLATSAYLLSANIHSYVQWKTMLSKQGHHIHTANTLRLNYIDSDVDQKWEDVAVFGVPTLRTSKP